MLTDLILDLDGTIYPNSNGLWEEIGNRINIFMMKEVGIAENEVLQLRESYFKKYGTTLRGLQHHNEVDSEKYLAFVHDIPLEKFISPDPKLIDIFNSLPQSKWILTNADANHAHRVLTFLGIRDQFSGLMGVSDNDFVTKPDLFPYTEALKRAKQPDSSKCLFADDLEKNLTPANELGFITLLIGNENSEFGADYACESIHCLPDIVDKIMNKSDEF